MERRGHAGAVTVGEAVEKYTSNRRWLQGSAAADRDDKLFARTLHGEPLARVLLAELDATHIEDWRNGLIKCGRSRQTANRILRQFKAAMNYAFKKNLIATQPWKSVDAFPVPERSRQTYLTIDERRVLLAASGPELRTFLTALLYTAARPGELERLTVRDLDLVSSTLRLTMSKGKGGTERERFFCLSGAALEFFRLQAAGKADGDLLVAPRGWGRTRWSRAIRKTVAGINTRRREVDPQARDFPVDVCCYDMRHTAISDWLVNSVDIGTVAKLAGTSVLMIDRHYHKFIRSAVAEQLAKIAVV